MKMRARTKWLIVLGVGAFAVLLASCKSLGWGVLNARIRREFPSVPRVSTAELARTTARPLLLDVRTPPEFAVSHLAGARRVDPGDDAAQVADLPLTEPIVTYCSVGYRSAQFAEKLQRAGYRDVRNLEGSIFAWANEGRPLVRDTDTPTREVHPFNRWWGLLLDR